MLLRRDWESSRSETGGTGRQPQASVRVSCVSWDTRPLLPLLFSSFSPSICSVAVRPPSAWTRSASSLYGSRFISTDSALLRTCMLTLLPLDLRILSRGLVKASLNPCVHLASVYLSISFCRSTYLSMSLSLSGCVVLFFSVSSLWRACRSVCGTRKKRLDCPWCSHARQAGETPTVAEPRWIKLRGGKYANKHMGDILLLFELVRKRDADQIPSYPMRPPVNICSLTFSCLGLRDLYMTQKGNSSIYL